MKRTGHVLRLRNRLSLLAALALACLVAGGVWAYFSSVGSGIGSASSGNLNASSKPGATANGTGRVDVTWHQATLSDGSTLAQKYYVSRYSGATLDSYACGTSPSGTTIPASAADGSGNFTCSDTGLTSAGPYTYTVTAIYKTWTAESAKSDPVTVSLIGPLDHFTITPASGTQTAGSQFSVTVTAKDASNNTITTYTGTVHFVVDTGSASLPPNYTFTTGAGNDNGSHTFTNGVTLRTTPSQTVTVNDTVTTSATGSATYTVIKASPTLSLAGPGNPGSGTAGTPISASSITANLAASSGANAGGTITFKYFQQALAPSTCTSGGTAVGTATVGGNGSYNPSAGFTPTVAGNYWLYASYGGDGNNNSAASACPPGTAQEIVVGKASPTISTALSATEISAGGSVHDSSTLSGLVNSDGTGTVTYSYYTNNTCTTGAQSAGVRTVSVSGVVPDSDTITFNSPGTFYWRAVYSGDANNNGASSPCSAVSNEQLTVYATDGSGTLTTPTTSVANGSTGNTITFTYTAATGGMSSGSVTLTVPTGWSTPSTTGSAAGFTTASTGTVGVSGQSITVSGVTLSGGSTMTIVYGSKASGGSGATATTTAGAQTWQGQQKSASTGTLANITPSPSIMVLSADGSGTISPSPSSMLAGSTGNTITFTYTAVTGGLNNGSVTIVVPSGWSAPSTTGSAAGFTTSTAGTVSVSGQTITISGVTLTGGSTFNIVYGSTANSGPGATATTSYGAQTWTTQERSTSGGTLTSLASQPSITTTASTDGSGTLTTTTTSVTPGSINNTITFTYTAATGGLNNGEVDVIVPTGWTAPVTNNAAGCTNSSTGNVTTSGQTIKVTGLTLAGGGSLTITYGATSGGACHAGDGATAPSTGGPQTWQGQEKSTSGGTLTNISPSPSITVLSADGSGTLTTMTANVFAGSAGNTITFTYTAAAGGLSNGEVDVTVPNGWTAPTAANAIGCTTASSGTLSFSGQTIKVSALTLAGSATLTITYGATSGGACTASDGATATSTVGAQTWQGQEKSNAGGALTNVASSPSIFVVGFWTWTANGAAQTWTTSTSKSVTYPTGTASGDLILLALVQQNGSNAPAPPTGWSLLDTVKNASSVRLTVYWRASGGEASVSLTPSANSAAWVVRYTRAGSVAPTLAATDATKGANSSSTMDAPSITTADPTATVISFVGIPAANTLSLSVTRSFALHAALTTTSPSPATAFGLADQFVTASGTAVTGPQWQQSGSAGDWGLITGAFN